MQHILALFFVLSSQFASAVCYERFYHQEHLDKKGVNQEVRSVILTGDHEDDVDMPKILNTSGLTEDDNVSKLMLQVFDYSENRSRNIVAYAICNREENWTTHNCRFISPLRGSFRVSKKAVGANTKYGDFILEMDQPLPNQWLNADESKIVSYDMAIDDDLFFVNREKTRRSSQGCLESQLLAFKYEKEPVRLWNEVILGLIREDLARPTVTARNLFHFSVLANDVYSCIHAGGRPFMLEPLKNLCHKLKIEEISEASFSETLYSEVMAYAAYSFLRHRYDLSPGNVNDAEPNYFDFSGDQIRDMLTLRILHRNMWLLQYNRSHDVLFKSFNEEVKYELRENQSNIFAGSKDHFIYTSSASIIGSRFARELIKFYRDDGANEVSNYINPVSKPLINSKKGTPLYMDFIQPGMYTPWRYKDVLFADATEEDKKICKSIDDYFIGGCFRWNQTYPMGHDIDIDHWVPLGIPDAVGQNANKVSSEQEPLTLHWGHIKHSFGDLKSYESHEKKGVFFDPVDDIPKFSGPRREEFVKANLDVARASQVLDPIDLKEYKKDFNGDGIYDENRGSVLIDISPGATGNSRLGTNENKGRKYNPYTEEPYKKTYVRSADFYRSLAEFWADGPSSETPPGHWNVISNYVLEQMERYDGKFTWAPTGEVLSKEEFTVRLYLTLNGALHDAAIVAWGIKASYEGSRPITVIRKLALMAETDPNFAKWLISVSDGLLRMVEFEAPNERLQSLPDGSIYESGVTSILEKGIYKGAKQTVKKLAMKAWRGHYYYGLSLGEDVMAVFKDDRFSTSDPIAKLQRAFYDEEHYGAVGGVGWITADNWMPYQKTNFVTPPFPGFVSGHSTFSRAAAEVLSYVTGSSYFPGGLGTYKAPKLAFERSSFDYDDKSKFEFQWATYCDASDQSGVSRIYGGIHASFDDLPARKIGAKVGLLAAEKSSDFYGSNKSFDAHKILREQPNYTFCDEQ